ncbi:MAG: alpha/beta hydrolase [Pseudomonadota bacterium]
MGLKLFLHGVPDTPSMWDPVIAELGGHQDSFRVPALPGFVTPAPSEFSATKEAYVDWFIQEIEQAHQDAGPVDLIGHDWGALITVRAASLKPELINSWCVANALPHPDYQWHRMARMWQTPILGEVIMALSRKEALCKALHAAGIPADLASKEASHWSPHMRRAILKLYRSAKFVGSEWWDDTKHLPDRGLVFWGEDDPYVPTWIADKFCAATGARLEKQPNTGHWSIIERADILAGHLDQLWGNQLD